MALAGGFTWSDGAGGTLREREGREASMEGEAVGAGEAKIWGHPRAYAGYKMFG